MVAVIVFFIETGLFVLIWGWLCYESFRLRPYFSSKAWNCNFGGSLLIGVVILIRLIWAGITFDIPALEEHMGTIQWFEFVQIITALILICGAWSKAYGYHLMRKILETAKLE